MLARLGFFTGLIRFARAFDLGAIGKHLVPFVGLTLRNSDSDNQVEQFRHRHALPLRDPIELADMCIGDAGLIESLERNHSLRSGTMPSSSPILSIVAPVSPLAAVWTTMTPL